MNNFCTKYSFAKRYDNGKNKQNVILGRLRSPFCCFFRENLLKKMIQIVNND